MPPDFQLIFGAMGAAISVLFGALILVYREALAEERGQNRDLREKVAGTLDTMADTLDSVDKGMEIVTEYVLEVRAEARVEARKQQQRRLDP